MEMKDYTGMSKEVAREFKRLEGRVNYLFLMVVMSFIAMIGIVGIIFTEVM
jgi:hypothetical protein